MPVDDLIFGAAIADFVIRHAWEPGSEFLLLHVVEPLPATEAPPAFVDEAIDEDMTEAQKLVRRLATELDSAFKGAKIVDSKVEWGSPKDKILEVAKDWKATVIVMGSHGRHGLNRLIMGSVSVGVMCHAHCSIVIIRGPSQEPT